MSLIQLKGLAVAILVSMSVSSCGLFLTMGSGVMASATRSLDSFNALSVNGDGIVTIVQSTNLRVQIDAEDNLIPKIKTTVFSDVLTISPENVWPSKPMNLTVSAASLDSLILSGSGKIILSNGFTNNSLSVIIRGSGTMDCFVQTKSLSANLEGSGTIILSGNADSESLIISGSGNIDASEVSATDGNIKIMGSGNGKARITGNANVNISGSGTVSLKIAPTNLSQTIAGTGIVTIDTGK